MCLRGHHLSINVLHAAIDVALVLPGGGKGNGMIDLGLVPLPAQNDSCRVKL